MRVTQWPNMRAINGELFTWQSKYHARELAGAAVQLLNELSIVSPSNKLLYLGDPPSGFCSWGWCRQWLSFLSGFSFVLIFERRIEDVELFL